MVAAGRARGWASIRFTGGSEAFQRRARLEAIRQGYQLDQVSLEIEDGKTPPASLSMPMPDHVRRRLLPSQPPTETAPPAPSPEANHAPGYRPS